MTHELNNVIAVINEIAGLISDMAEDSNPADTSVGKSLERIQQRLAAQVERGGKIVKRLNNFAHTADEQVKAFDLGPVLENLVELSRRFASLKKISLEISMPPGPILLTGDPFKLQRAIFMAIASSLESPAPRRIISILTRVESAKAEVLIEGMTIDKNEAAKAKFSEMKILTEEAGGRFEFGTGEHISSLSLTFPLTIAQKV